jgi:rubredoxin
MELITCTMCGHRFDPAVHQTCGSCPLQRGCQLVCCPACGFEMVNPERSLLARLAKRWLSPAKDIFTTDPSQRS